MGNDTMSKALRQISKSPFTRRIDRANEQRKRKKKEENEQLLLGFARGRFYTKFASLVFILVKLAQLLSSLNFLGIVVDSYNSFSYKSIIVGLLGHHSHSLG